jgi:hypothetical protein
MRWAPSRVVAACAACALGLLASAPPVSSNSPPTVQELLRTVAQFDDASWSAVQRGQSVARALETDSREIAVAGAVRITGSRDALVDRYRDIENLKRSSVVLDAARFSTPPQPADLARAPFEDRSLNLRICRTGDCQVRLTAPAVERFQREVDWAGPQWRLQSAALWRDVLASYALSYLRGGRRGLPEYVNKGESLSVASELALLLQEYAFVAQYSPEFYAYLQNFGPGNPAGGEGTLYWTKEDFGIRPVLRISHQVIYPARTGPPSTWIAVNQVYADHYLDAAISLTAAIDANDGGRSFYMVSISRARTRSLSGFLRRFVRATVQSRSRDAMEKILTSTKAAVETRAQHAVLK